MPTAIREADDAVLIRACRRGDEKAWEILVRRYRRLIFSIPIAYRLGPADADEIFQRVTVKLFSHLGSVRKSDRLAAWLSVTARRECQAYIRAGRRWDRLEESGPGEPAADPVDVAQALVAVESQHALALAFERLDPACRALLGALYLEEPAPSYQQLATRLGRPIGSLGPTKSRCLEKLRRLYLAGGGQAPSGGT